MKILITGGAGFIGSHLVEHFQETASEIRVLDNLRTGSLSNLRGLKHTFIHGSVTDPAIVREALKGIDLVFHLAALVSVEESISKPIETVEINVMGLLNVLDAASAAGVGKLIFASSAAIYGDNPTIPKTEEMLPEPKSPYAITKLDGEHYLNLYHVPGKFETCAVRFFNVFGPRQNPKGGYAAAVPIFYERARKSETIRIFGDGEQTRDFIFVKDIVSAMDFASSASIHGVYNVGYGSHVSINELARTIVEITASNSTVEYLPNRPGDVKHSLASVSRLLSAGWSPQFDLESGLRITACSVT